MSFMIQMLLILYRTESEDDTLWWLINLVKNQMPAVYVSNYNSNHSQEVIRSHDDQHKQLLQYIYVEKNLVRNSKEIVTFCFRTFN